jgi:hypothetical protein
MFPFCSPRLLAKRERAKAATIVSEFVEAAKLQRVLRSGCIPPTLLHPLAEGIDSSTGILNPFK